MIRKLNPKFRFFKKAFLILLISITVFLFYFYKTTQIFPPEVPNQSILEENRIKVSENVFKIGDSFLHKNTQGLYEIYVQGKPFERGVQIGKLAQELIHEQEAAFINGIEALVPSRNYLNFLKYLVAWQNRNLPEYVNAEFQKEIYGLSFFAADEYDFIGPKYHRKLIYHAAHDIGHTMQNLGLVGCTTLSAWGERALDSSLILGRNFDFYVGDDFAKNKVVYFIRPNEGIPFASISWPGFMGVVSGMNLEGLAVTLNAGPPSYPGSSKTPISIVAREILQYASNIEEAFEIAKKREVFVSENIIIASAKDNKSVVIEKTPQHTILFEKSNDYLICSNHFQSEELKDSEENIYAQKETSTINRYSKMDELLSSEYPIDVEKTVRILRNQKGPDDRNIGMGNEMALNQLIAHHSVIFKPLEKQMWVSTSPWQLGAFVAYDLEDIFTQEIEISDTLDISNPSLFISADSIIYSNDFQDYLTFRKLKEDFKKYIQEENKIPDTLLQRFEVLNPEHYLTYSILGDYFKSQNNCEKALSYYRRGLEKAIPWKRDREYFLEGIEACNDMR